MADAAHDASFCPQFHQAAELVGRRWTGAIIRALLQAPRRFNDLLAAIPGLSARMLSERLKELETEGIVVRQVATEGALRVDYELTYKGRALEKTIDAITEWAHDFVEAQPDAGEAPAKAAGGARRKGRR